MTNVPNETAADLAIVIPVLNDAPCLVTLLQQLKSFKGQIIVVDGGSQDDSIPVAESLGARVVESEPGRAKQMNIGATYAEAKVLLFLHADTVLPEHFASLIAGGMRHERFHWGRFDVRLSGDAQMLRLVEFMMNLRSSFTGICTGDQGIFVKKEVFQRFGPFPEIELMEDVAFSKLMLRKPYCINHPIVTSSRRWEQQGVIKTIVLMWWLRLKFFLGSDPSVLAKQYRQSR